MTNAQPQQPDSHVDRNDAPIALSTVLLVATALTPGLVWTVAGRPLPTRFTYALSMTVAVLVAALALVATLSRGFRYRIGWSLSVAAITVAMVFHWPALTYVGRVVARVARFGLLADIVPVLLAVVGIALAVRVGGERQFAALFGSIALVAVAILTIVAMPTWVRGSPAERGVATPGAPDVVMLVLDGYVRSDVLAEDFAYDNTAFEQALTSRGFEIPDSATANYSQTYASLASILQLDYIIDEGPIDEVELDAMRQGLAGQASLLETFRAAGYEIAYAENSWAGSYCGFNVDICWRIGLPERVLWNLAQASVLAPLVSELRAHPFNTVSVSHLQSLPELVAADRNPTVPRLTIAHVILPHPPFLLNGRCERLPASSERSLFPWDDSTQNRRAYYGEQLTCTNRLVMEAVDQLLADRPETVIMITGDHGSDTPITESRPTDEWPSEWIAERLKIFSAYRAPGCAADWYETITPVNGVRLITNCVLASDLPILEDRSLMLPRRYEGAVYDAGPILDG